MALDRVKLTLEADADGDDVLETGIFEFVHNWQLSAGVRTGFLVGGEASAIQAIVSESVAAGTDKRQGFYVDLGAGQHVIEFDATIPEGASDDTGTLPQWGNDASQSSTQASATGQGPMTQLSVLERYLVTGEFDSRRTATLEFGEWHSGGTYSALDVVLEQPTITHNEETEPNSFDVSATFITAASVGDVLHGSNQNPY